MYLSAVDPDALKDWHGLFVMGILRPALVTVILPFFRRPVQDFKITHGLTTAELEIVEALVAGASTKEIASTRSVSIHTVRTQLKSAMAKCNVTKQSQLAVLAARF